MKLGLGFPNQSLTSRKKMVRHATATCGFVVMLNSLDGTNQLK